MVAQICDTDRKGYAPHPWVAAQSGLVIARTRGQPPERRAAIRQGRAAPRLDELESWLQSQLPKISAKTPLAAAIRHALTRLRRLRPYLEHGFLEIDNNPAHADNRIMPRSSRNPLHPLTAGLDFAA